MLQKKYVPIILGALCVFLLLSLLSPCIVRAEQQKLEGFEDAQQPDMTPEAFDKVLNNLMGKVNIKSILSNETPADADAFDKLLKKKLVHFLASLPVPYRSVATSDKPKTPDPEESL
jgi:hypothetical protein